MKSMKTLLAAAVAASALSAPAAFSEVEVSASAAVANMYLWRGFDLGDGSAAVSGDVTVSMAGAYAGIWASSGDSALGNEYDLYVGYGLEAGGFTVDLSLWNYNYSDAPSDSGRPGNDTTGELSEVILSVGYGPVAVTYYDNVAGASDYSYLTVGAEYGQFSALLGMTDSDKVSATDYDNGLTSLTDNDYMHLDLSYAYNDNFSLTLSKIIDDGAEDTDAEKDDDLQVVVAYSLAF